MSIRHQLYDALREITRDLFMSTSGRVTVAIAAAVPVIVWSFEGPEYDGWDLFWWLLLTPFSLIFWTAVWQFLAGVVFALVHVRRPKHSYVLLNLKDGRRRHGLACESPCCLRRRIQAAMKSPRGKFVWSLGDGSDDEEFGRDEIESWAVMPVDDPDPHATHGGAR